VKGVTHVCARECVRTRVWDTQRLWIWMCGVSACGLRAHMPVHVHAGSVSVCTPLGVRASRARVS